MEWIKTAVWTLIAVFLLAVLPQLTEISDGSEASREPASLDEEAATEGFRTAEPDEDTATDEVLEEPTGGDYNDEFVIPAAQITITKPCKQAVSVYEGVTISGGSLALLTAVLNLVAAIRGSQGPRRPHRDN